ncbi:MAG: universal stress protein, partial [Gammaproteobacteria bacterium]|nr:universal stress protein [Gammaproteobacteria bacterium]
MAARPAKAVKRIVVAVDSTLHSLASLDTAAELAAELQAHLETLFIEDVNLLHLAELPFASELDRTSGELRRVDPSHIASALQAQARRVQRALNIASAERHIQSSLRVVRGHYINEATALTGVDVLFMSTSTLAVTSRHQYPASRTGAKARPSLPVYVFYDGSASAERALSLASELASMLNAELVALRPTRESAALRALEDRAHELLGADRSVRFETVTDRSDSISAKVSATGCALLVIPRQTPDTPSEP